MTAFVNDDGEYLDYSGPDVGVTRQCANFFDFKIKGEISVTLNISNNSQNRKALGYFGTQQIDSPAFSKVQFNMVRDGNVISRGYVVIQGADESRISCFYISGNTNWFQNFQFNLKDIEFDDRFTVLNTDFDDRKSATEGIVFPLIDWWASNKRAAENYLVIRGYSAPETWGLNEIHPCLYLHTLMDQMGRHGGITIGGDLVGKKVGGTVDSQDGDQLYKKIILTPDGPDYYVPDSLIDDNWIRISANQGVLYDYTLDPQVVQLGSFIDGGTAFQYSGSPDYSWTATVTGTYRMDLDIAVNPSASYDIYLYKNGANYATVSTGNVEYKSITRYINLRAGDYLQLYVDRAAASNYRMNGTNGRRTTMQMKLEKQIGIIPDFNFLLETDGYVIPSAIVPDMKAIDLIKFVAFYFGCVVTFDEYSNTIELNLLKNFRKEEAEDWSEYFVSSKTDFKTGVGAKNYIQTEEGPELEIDSYNSQSNVSYGGGVIETPFDSMEEKTLYTVPFSGSWDEPNPTSSGMFWPYVMFYELEIIESVAYSGVTDAGGFATFTSTFQDNLDLATTVFYVDSASGIYTGFFPPKSAATVTTNPTLFVDYVSGDTGTIIAYKLSKVKAGHRMLVCNHGQELSMVGGGSDITLYRNSTSVDTMTTAPIAWYDKPVMDLPIDSYDESLAIDTNKRKSVTISERYYGPIKKIFSNPKVVAEFTLPLSVFEKFDFKKYVYIKTKDLTGYFIVQKIENYRDALTPVRVELLYAD